jgi:transcriptional antiterminator Rof (Rho-off)
VNLKEIGCDGVDWIEMAEDSCRYRVLWACSIKGGEFVDCLSDYQFLKQDCVHVHEASGSWNEH